MCLFIKRRFRPKNVLDIVFFKPSSGKRKARWVFLLSTPTAAAPVTIAASALDRGAATDVALDTSSQPRSNTPLTIRTSATPGPSGRPTVSTSRQVSETVDHDSALRQARIGKKRAASSENIGTGSKRARQDVEKYMYTYVLLNGIAA